MSRTLAEQLRRLPVAGIVRPVPVAPQHHRVVSFDQVDDLGVEDVVDVLGVGIALVAPIEQRVVRAEQDVVAFARGRVFDQHVASGAVLGQSAIGSGRVPPRPAVMVFRDEDGVPGPGIGRERRPRLGVEAVEREQRDEVVEPLDVAPPIAVVGENLDERLRMKQHVVDVVAEVAPVPLRILADRRPRRHARRRGVDQQSEPSLAPPRRHRHRTPILALSAPPAPDGHDSHRAEPYGERPRGGPPHPGVPGDARHRHEDPSHAVRGVGQPSDCWAP